MRYAFSSDCRRVVMSSFDKTARLWDAAVGTLQMTLKGHAGSVDDCAFSSDITRIVAASHDKTARLWDVKTGANLCTYFAPAPVYCADFWPIDGTCLTIATGNEHRLVRIHSDTTHRDPE